MCRKLKNDILFAAKKVGLDPYKQWFKPSDLKINATKFGSFSDHCLRGTTKSSRYCGCGLLEANSNIHPRKYRLLK